MTVKPLKIVIRIIQPVNWVSISNIVSKIRSVYYFHLLAIGCSQNVSTVTIEAYISCIIKPYGLLYLDFFIYFYQSIIHYEKDLRVDQDD